jgi:hypothetical protein
VTAPAARRREIGVAAVDDDIAGREHAASAFTVDSVASPAGTISQMAFGAASVEASASREAAPLGARRLGAGHRPPDCGRTRPPRGRRAASARHQIEAHATETDEAELHRRS